MRRIFYTLIFLSSAFFSFGQSTIRPSIYFQDMNFYNPSAIALDSTENYSLSLYGKHKFVDNSDAIWNKPTRFHFNHVGRIKTSNSFYTVSYLNDRYSFFDRNGVSAGYTYQKKWGRFSSLSAGVRMVLNFDRINWDQLKTPHEETGHSMKLNPDIDLGLQYKVKGFTLGLSAKNTIAFSTKLDGRDLLKNQREFYLNTSYLFKIGEHIQVAPYTLLRWERNIVIDGGVYVSLFNIVNASYLFRLNELRSIYTLDVRVFKTLHVGVAFDHSKLFPDHNLDIMLRYVFGVRNR